MFQRAINDQIITPLPHISAQVFFAVYLTAIVISQSTFMSDFTKAKSAAASIFSILDRKSKIDSSKEDGLTLDESKGDIEFKQVCFAYPTRPDIQVLNGLSLKISSGQVYIHIYALNNCY